VLLANFSKGSLTIPKATILGVAEDASESTIDRISANAKSSVNTPTKPPRKKKIKNIYDKFFNGKLDYLPREVRQHIQHILRKYDHVFSVEESKDFKETRAIEHQILVGDAKPIWRPPYRTPYALKDEMQTQVQYMLNKGIIMPSTSPWSAPAILVPKKSQHNKQKFRFGVDFRALNSVTQFELYSLPVFEKTTSTLYCSNYFTVLD